MDYEKYMMISQIGFLHLKILICFSQKKSLQYIVNLLELAITMLCWHHTYDRRILIMFRVQCYSCLKFFSNEYMTNILIIIDRCNSHEMLFIFVPKKKNKDYNILRTKYFFLVVSFPKKSFFLMEVFRLKTGFQISKAINEPRLHPVQCLC